MGIWDFISSTTDWFKRKTPDLTPVKGFCRSSYDYGLAGVNVIDNAVRVNGVARLNHHLADHETRDKIVRFTTTVAKNAAVYAFQEGAKAVPVPGLLPAYNIVSRSMRDMKRSGDQNSKMKELKTQNRKGDDELIVAPKSSLDEAEIHKPDDELKSQNTLESNSKVHHKPEDMIRIFMMKEFMGKHFLDDLIVPGVRSNKNPK